MPTDALLRPAVEGDADAVASVHLAARRAAAMPPGIHTDDEVRAWLAGRLRSDDEVWVAEVHGAVAAYARITDDLARRPVRRPGAPRGTASARRCSTWSRPAARTGSACGSSR